MASPFSLSSPSPAAAAAASPSPSHRGLATRRSSASVGFRGSPERQALFSRIAPAYDDLNDLLSLGLHRVWKRMAVSWSGAKKAERVLDLCCGSGDLAFLLSERVGPHGELETRRSSLHTSLVNPMEKIMFMYRPRMAVSVSFRWFRTVSEKLKEILASKVTGLDFSKQQLLIAAARQDLSGKTCYKNIVWVEGDALNLSFPACYFDAVTVGYGLRNLVDKRKAMEEIFRVLKPGSRVSILDFNKSSNASTASFQEYMIDNVVVPVASSYGLAKEYAYLKTSIQEFLTGKELEKLAKEVGFSDAKHYEISGGLMGNLVATR